MARISATDQVLLAFDYGIKRIGVALSRSGEATTEALTTIDASADLASQLKPIILKYQPAKAIVGRPRNLDGEPTAQTQAAERFGRMVEQNFSLPVEFVDEALSSQRARQRLGRADRRTEKRLLDQIAAQIILEDYINEAG